MNALVGGGVKAGLFAGGWYSRRLNRDAFPGVLVLCYHGVRSARWRAAEPSFPDLHVAEDTFDAHCRMIAATCHPISLDDWRAASHGARTLPERPVLVTFDDGYRSVYEVARPLLQRHRIPAAVFVCSDPIERQQLFAFDAAARGVAADAPVDPADPLAPMTADQVSALAADGFEIGAHGASHRRLAECAAAEQRDELASCREAVAAWTGSPVRSLAYPFGKPDADYTAETVATARSLAFDAAFSTVPDFARVTSPALERPRFLVLSEVTAHELAHRIAYAWPR
jgi:peptidoglycan/xylan/chitin deacetylase (PgdA/CDA1 family)